MAHITIKSLKIILCERIVLRAEVIQVERNQDHKRLEHTRHLMVAAYHNLASAQTACNIREERAKALESYDAAVRLAKQWLGDHHSTTIAVESSYESAKAMLPKYFVKAINRKRRGSGRKWKIFAGGEDFPEIIPRL
eukprot:gene19520-974_t